MASDSIGYRERYERLFRNFCDLERQIEEQDQFLRLALGRLYFVVEEAYPQLAGSCQAGLGLLTTHSTGLLPLDHIKPLTERLSRHILDTEAHAPPVPTEHGSPTSEAHLILTQLLSRLDICATQESTCDDIREQLRTPLPSDQLTALLDQIAELANASQRTINKESESFATFLKRIDHALINLDRGTQKRREQIKSKQDRHKQLNRKVNDNLEEIYRTVDSKHDVVTLQKEVRNHLQLVQQHLDQFERDEDKYISQSLQENEELRNHIRLLEKQTTHIEGLLEASMYRLLHDDQTGLANRLALIKHLDLCIEQARSMNKPFCLSLWDIDDLRLLNEQFGREIGDKALSVVGQTLVNFARPDDIVARSSGEEFALLLTDINPKAAHVLVDKIRKRLSRIVFRYRNQPVHLTLSCVLTTYLPRDTPGTLFERLEQGLGQAKQQGRNQRLIV